jgi:hypothetical protein
MGGNLAKTCCSGRQTFSPEVNVQIMSELFVATRAAMRTEFQHPDATEAEVRKEIFRRSYGHELPQSLIEGVERDIDERFGGQPAVRA